MKQLLIPAAILLVFALVGIYLYVKANSTRVGAWRSRVLRYADELNARLRQSQAVLDRVEADRKSRREPVLAEFRKKLYQSTDVGALANYEGIGDGLVGNLREAGYKTLKDVDIDWLSQAMGGIQAKNIGETRRKYIGEAVKQLKAEIEKSFAEGNFEGADEMRRRFAEIDRELDRKSAEAEAEANAVKATIAELRPMAEVAGRISLLDAFKNKGPEGLDDLFLDRELPKVGKIEVRETPVRREEPAPATAPAPSTPTPAPTAKRKPANDDPFGSYEPSAPVKPSSAPKPTAPASTPIPPPSPTTDYRAALEIGPKVELNADLIRRQYNLLTSKLDVDKAKVLGDDIAATVAAKRDKVKEAAEALMKPFGEPLVKEKPPEPTDMRHNPDLDSVFG